MNETIGSRIAKFRKAKNMTQEELASQLGLSSQAVSKWENDASCPDISLLPMLAKSLDVTVDELLTGEKQQPLVQLLPQEKRKDIKDMTLRVVVDSADGDKVRVNLPLALVQIVMETGMQMPQINGNAALQGIDWKQIMELISQGAVGNLVEVESSDGDVVKIFVE